MREVLIVSGWGFRLKKNEKEKEGEAGCQRLCALAERPKFINITSRSPRLCLHDFT